MTRLAAFLLLAAPLSAAPIDATWLGGPGNYTDAVNWSTDPVVPINGGGATYNVSVPGGSLTLDTNATVDTFALGPVQLAVVGAKTITAATTFDANAVISGGVLGLAGSAQLTAAGADRYLNLAGGAEISNAGSFTQARTGAGESGLVLNADASGSGATFRNAAGGTFTASMTAGDGSVGYGAANAANRFVNAGTFLKTGSHDYAANVAFQNSGTAALSQGTLTLNAGDGGATTGAFTVSSGATLALGGGFTFASGASVVGGGALQAKGGATTFQAGSSLSAASLRLTTGTLAFRAGSGIDAATALTVEGGTLELDVDHAFTGAAFTTNGSVTGAGRTTFAGATAFGSGSYVFGGGVKEFAGTATFATAAAAQYFNVNGGAEVANTGSFTQLRNGGGANGIVLNADLAGGGSTFRNAAGGTFTANMAAGSGSVGAGAAHAGNRFLNEGTFTKTGAGDYDFNVAFANQGSVALQQGVINANFGDGGATTGSFALNGGTTLALGGSFTFGSGAAVGGAGALRVKSGTATFGSGASLTAGALDLLGGTTTFQAGSSLGSTALAVNGGTLQLDIDHTFTGATFTNGGSVTGAGAATFAGATSFDQSSYTFGGAGRKTFSGTVSLGTASADQFFNVRGGAQVVNTGSFTQARAGSGQSALVLNSDSAGGASIFRNAAGGAFTASMTGGPGSIGFGAASTANQFLNAGAFAKTGSHEYAINVRFANTGAVAVQQGLLSLNAGDGGATTGSLAVASGATAALSGGFTFAGGAAVTGAGTLQNKTGSTTFAAGSSFSTASLQVTGGTMRFQAGSTLGSTALAIAGGTLELDVDHTFTGASFANGGGVTGTGVATFAGSTAIDASSYVLGGTGVKKFTGTATLASAAADQFLNLAGGTELQNTGSFTQTRGGAGASDIVLNFDHAGPSVFRNAAGGSFTANVSAGVASIGYGGADPGNAFVNAGTVTKNGAGLYQINVPLQNSGSLVAHQGTLSVTAALSGSGSLNIDTGATLDLSENVHANAAGALTHNGSTLALGANDLTLSGDYRNAAFGAGNTFDGRANVTGAGRILAAGDAALAVGGQAAGGALNFGVVHVGDSPTKTYTLTNTGTTGAAPIRGAIQTVNGGGITDSRLTGAGVTAANFARLQPGASTPDLAVTFQATAAGPLSGQAIHIATNFDNVTVPDLAIQGAANFYAQPAFANGAGAAGLVRNNATSYTIDFGATAADGGALAFDFDLLNELLDAIYQDNLNGAFDLSAISHFDLTGFGPFANIAPGLAHDLEIGFDPAALSNGVYRDTLVFTPASSNASGSWNRNPIQLTLQATVVPEPGVTALLLLAAATLIASKRRRQESP